MCTIKAYAIGSEQRSAGLPDVPTSKEAGLPEFQAMSWLSPCLLPRTCRSRSSTSSPARLDKALDDGNSRKRLLDLGNEVPDKGAAANMCWLLW
jgi:tripartite-type tricarboxylate transporter receptor subunit TctC